MDCGHMGALWAGVWCSGQTGAAAAGPERSIAFTSAAGAGRLTQGPTVALGKSQQ